AVMAVVDEEARAHPVDNIAARLQQKAVQNLHLPEEMATARQNAPRPAMTRGAKANRIARDKAKVRQQCLTAPTTCNCFPHKKTAPLKVAVFLFLEIP